jgi:predicted CoA-binding protein
MKETMASLLQCKKWALVGATSNKSKFGYKILQVMRNNGLHVFAVNPGLQEIDGQPCYASLADLPEAVEAVNVVVPPKVALGILEDCQRLNISNVWLQPGADTAEVVEKAKALGLQVVYDACIMIELRHKGGV